MSLEALIALSRKEWTPDEIIARGKAFKERMQEQDRQFIERFRCRTCGADTINYSHSFSCPWRGTGF